MRYQIKVHYRTPLMDKVTDYMQHIIDEWRESDKHLQGCRVFEVETTPALTPEQIEQIKGAKQDWMDSIEIEEVADNDVH